MRHVGIRKKKEKISKEKNVSKESLRRKGWEPGKEARWGGEETWAHIREGCYSTYSMFIKV